MENIRHIHEVLEILYSGDKRYKVEEFPNELVSIFGKNVQFTSCSENVFDLPEVVSFLLSRNKIRLDENVIIPLTPPCNH